MTQYRRVKRDSVRALLSEILPFEAPLPFGTIALYRFLRKIKFQWVDAKSFKVKIRGLGAGEKLYLKLIFDGIQLTAGTESAGWLTYTVSLGSAASRTIHPYRFTARRNNGKIRELTVLHPQSMLEMARFVDDYNDVILFYTNKSPFSIRHPARVSRIEVKRDGIFTKNRDRDAFDIEQHNLEYEHTSSYFSYKKYNNINRFYTSSEFNSCERKYQTLMRVDISNCFPSIYTHTISWVTNGRHTSKSSVTRKQTENTFGGRFDSHLQALNYGETSGIVIGPEFSRIFAEILLQEVDVRVERDLAGLDLHHGVHYEIMRYVDDYFIFLGNPSDAGRVEDVIARHLAHFKLHLNERKKEILPTPLRSNMSVAKYRIRKGLKKATKCTVDLDTLEADLFFSSSRAIIEYKSILLDVDLEHGELANYYLYTLIRRMSKTCDRYKVFIDQLRSTGSSSDLRAAASNLAKYLVSVIDVAFFVYAGAPSSSHSFKLSHVIVSCIRELELAGLSHLEMTTFRDKIRRELLAQLMSVQEVNAVGVHTLNLLDCLVHLENEFTNDQLEELLAQRDVAVDQLEVFALLMLLRVCGDSRETASFRKSILNRCRALVELGKNNPDFETQRAILLLSLPANLKLSVEEARKSVGLSANEIVSLRSSVPMTLFAWDADEHYYERLLLKSVRMVY